MATMMSKLKGKEKVEEQAEVVVKIRKDEEIINDTELHDAIVVAADLVESLRHVELKLKEQKKIIEKKARELLGQQGTITFIVATEAAGIIECKVTFQYEAVIPADRVDPLRNILGGRFDDLVRVKTTYYATPKLIELATDGDRGKEIAECITVKEKAAQITFK